MSTGANIHTHNNNNNNNNNNKTQDGNTWNHEHIALLGRALTSPPDEAYAIARHLADYVLIWTTAHAGMHGDDLAKSPHMARIAASVFKSIDGDNFRMDRDRNPSDSMRASLLYALHGQGIVDGVAPLDNFEEVYTSVNQMVRIYKVKNADAESRAFCEANPGHYPPALAEILAESEDFAQLEDFNARKRRGT